MAEAPYLVREPIDSAALAAGVSTPADGAVATFVGVVRDSHDGRKVLWLEYEAHEEMARKQVAALIDEARRRWPVTSPDTADRSEDEVNAKEPQEANLKRGLGDSRGRA